MAPASTGHPLDLYYDVDLSLLDHHHHHQACLAEKYMELHCDDETQAFLSKSTGAVLDRFWKTCAAKFLNVFLSVTDTNAILSRGQMFVLSPRQIQALLQENGPGYVLLFLTDVVIQ